MIDAADSFELNPSIYAKHLRYVLPRGSHRISFFVIHEFACRFDTLVLRDKYSPEVIRGVMPIAIPPIHLYRRVVLKQPFPGTNLISIFD